jgi:hypothetical protein
MTSNSQSRSKPFEKGGDESYQTTDAWESGHRHKPIKEVAQAQEEQN